MPHSTYPSVQYTVSISPCPTETLCHYPYPTWTTLAPPHLDTELIPSTSSTWTLNALPPSPGRCAIIPYPTWELRQSPLPHIDIAPISYYTTWTLCHSLNTPPGHCAIFTSFGHYVTLPTSPLVYCAILPFTPPGICAILPLPTWSQCWSPLTLA